MKELFQATIKGESLGFIKNKKYILTISSYCKEALKEDSQTVKFFVNNQAVGMPIKKTIFTVNRSPCGQNKSKEQFSYILYTKAYTFLINQNEASDKLLQQITARVYKKKNVSFSWRVEGVLTSS